MSKEKRDVRPGLLHFAVAGVLSIGGIVYTFLRNERSKLSSDSDSRSSSRGNGNDSLGLQKPEDSVRSEKHVRSFGRKDGETDSYLLPELDEFLKDISTESGDEQEIQRLRQAVKILKERETDLEIQLFEYYGLKEQEAAFLELQNGLKIKNMEARLFSLKLESLQADKKILEEQVSNHAKVSAELEAAKGQISFLKRKLKSQGEHNKEQILALQERARKIQEQEKSELQRLKDLEEEAEELRKSNDTLTQEKSELSQKLEYLQLIATSAMDSDERESLQQKNENLTKEVEQLQASRCSDVEELVYLRWLNACLRYELRNYQPGPSRDLNKTLSPKSEQKVKELILEYASKESQDEKGKSFLDFDSEQWFSSQNSSHTDSGDDSSVDMVMDTKTHASKKPQVFGKFMRLLQGKERGKHNRSKSGETSSFVENLEDVSEGSNTGFSSYLQRTSDDGPTLCIFRSMDAIAENNNHSTQLDQAIHVPDDIQKAELVKYAESLKVSRKISSKRSVFGSF